jgi:hypothetical protein
MGSNLLLDKLSGLLGHRLLILGDGDQGSLGTELISHGAPPGRIAILQWAGGVETITMDPVSPSRRKALAGSLLERSLEAAADPGRSAAMDIGTAGTSTIDLGAEMGPTLTLLAGGSAIAVGDRPGATWAVIAPVESIDRLRLDWY